MFCRTWCLPNPFHTVHVHVPFTLYGRLPQCVISRPLTDGCVSHNVECSPLAARDLTVKYCMLRKTRKFGCHACE